MSEGQAGPDRPDLLTGISLYADGALDAFRELAGKPLPYDGSGGELLSLRASLMHLQAQKNISANGSCRLLPARDGVLAINLSRDSDWDLLHAWLRTEADRTWEAVTQCVLQYSCSDLVEQGRLLGLAVAPASAPETSVSDWLEVTYRSHRKYRRRNTNSQSPAVLDLSSLWAGPLCSRLLAWAGAGVTKLESTRRPDGARFSSPAFFSFLNAGKKQVQLDLSSAGGIAQLRQMIKRSDIVIEGSRPRALRQMGINAEHMLEENPHLTWLSITGYGRGEPYENWIAYGDDAGVAAGLSRRLYETTGEWRFCGDAIADPLTGMHGALAALQSWREGGGQLLSLSMVGTVRHCMNAMASEAA